MPILIQQAIDKGVDEETGDVQFDLIVKMALIGAVAVIVSGFALRQASIRLGERSERALYDLRARLIGHIHQLSLATHNDERRGGLVSRVTSDIESLAQFFQWGGLAWLLDGTLMVIVAAVMLAYNWQLALIAFAVSMPLAFVLRAVQSRLVRAYDAARHANGDMLGAIAEVVSGTPTIRAYGAGEVLEQRVHDAVEVKTTAQIKASLIGAFLFPSGEIFSAFTISAVVGVGVWMGPSSSLTAGALVGFIFLTYRFLEPIAEFTEVLDQTQNAVAGLRRVLSVLDLPIGPPPPDDPIAAARRQAAHRHPRGDVLLPQPRSVTGADSAVLEEHRRHDPGRPAGGDRRLDRVGQDHARPADRPVRRPDDRRDRTRRRAARAGRPGRAAAAARSWCRRSRSCSTTRSAPTSRSPSSTRTAPTSSGWSTNSASATGSSRCPTAWRPGSASAATSCRQASVSSSRCCAPASPVPDVLILDEATSSVDALTEVRVARALERLAASRTTIAIAHRLSTAARADRVLVLEHGRLVEDGHHDELITNDGPYRRLYDAWVSATSV